MAPPLFKGVEVLVILTFYLSQGLIAFLIVKFVLHVRRNRPGKSCIRKRKDGYDLFGVYDNKIYYESISCNDYLIYQLNYFREEIDGAIREWHRERAKKKRPSRKTFTVKVVLILTNIRGRYLKSRNATFVIKDIRATERRLDDKERGRYLDFGVWNALCRVERGKVTNKMRFAIYKRDGYRCRKCHRKTKDLEVDHIVPISRGGKSNFSNLQTLCHRCNAEKGARTERWL